MIVSSSKDLSIRVWSPIKQECITVIKPKNKVEEHRFHKAPINCFALHPTDPVCVSGDLEGGVFWSNIKTGELGSRILSTHAESVESIAFCQNPDSPYCVSCGMDNKINIYDCKKFELRQKVEAAKAGGFTKIVFSKIDHNLFYASSNLGNVVVIDVRNGKI